MVERGGPLRLFAAVEVPAVVREAAERLLEAGRRALGGIRWVAAGNLHLTVKFLGDTPPERLGEIEAALASGLAGLSPFRVALRGLGAFPGARRPRVVFVGVAEGGEELTRLMEAADQAAARLGYPREARRPSPHLTIGRVGMGLPPGAVERWFREMGAVDLGSFDVREAALMASRLGPGGPRYERMAIFPPRVSAAEAG